MPEVDVRSGITGQRRRGRLLGPASRHTLSSQVTANGSVRSACAALYLADRQASRPSPSHARRVAG